MSLCFVFARGLKGRLCDRGGDTVTVGVSDPSDSVIKVLYSAERHY